MSKRARLLPQARDLYASGASIAAIAAELGVSRNSVAAWRRHDHQAGIDWDKLRRARTRTSPYAPIVMLNERLKGLIAGAANLDDPSFEDRLWKLIRALDRLEDRLGDATQLLSALEVFARWCRDHLADDDHEAVARAVERFCDALRDGKLGRGT